MKYIRVGRTRLEVTSIVVGMVAFCVLTAVPFVGTYLLKAFTFINSNVSKLFSSFGGNAK